MADPDPGQLLCDVAEAAGILLNTRCACTGICGGCAVKLGPGTYEIEGLPIHIDSGGYKTALACQTRVLSRSAWVSFPRSSVVERNASIEDEFLRIPFETRSGLRVLNLPVPARTRDDSLSLAAQFQQAFESRCKGTILPLDVTLLRRLPALLGESERRLTVTLMLYEDRWCVIDLAAAGSSEDLLGFAVDVGTTTVAAMLIDLQDGKVLAKASMYNQQICKADDVTSRISACRNQQALQELQRLVVEETFHPLLIECCHSAGHRDPRRVLRVALSGNTVMMHLFLGISPETIGTLPFQPVQRIFPAMRAGELGLNSAPNGRVELVPAISGFVGGDITSGLYVTGMHQTCAASLLIDIGTNGEMVLREGDRSVACATAAGPAFEGYGLAHGCRAARGAIERIRFRRDLDIDYDVIGYVAPVGLCGSAIIDFMACALHARLINSRGRFDLDRLRASGRYLHNPVLCGGSAACVIVSEEDSGISGPIFVSEADIAEVLKAKGAIFAGVQTLLRKFDMQPGDLKKVYLAGGFAGRLSIENAILMGLLPEIPLDRFELIGNASLAGAYLTLMDSRALETYPEIIDQPTVTELNREADFESNFIDALCLPNMEENLFPRTTAYLREWPCD